MNNAIIDDTEISEDITAYYNPYSGICIRSDYYKSIVPLYPSEALALLRWLTQQQSAIEALQEQEETI